MNDATDPFTEAVAKIDEALEALEVSSAGPGQKQVIRHRLQAAKVLLRLGTEEESPDHTYPVKA